ncbi:MAG: phosphoribosylamine--glycine ligase, partial [Chloroflexi bacterium]|nr:phosphoribosylamine--glycine ligase [Chloroflexota bacterium]
RFGDPEAEVLLPRMESDLLPLLVGCARGELDPAPIRWKPEAAVCVVLTSEGYPDAYASGRPIAGWEAVSEPEGATYAFHAGTALHDGELVTAGGRVLAVTALGSDLEQARSNAYAAADRIQFEGVYRRSDIGRRQTGSGSA